MSSEKDETEEAIRAFLGGQPRAEEIAQMRRLLQQRAEDLRALLDHTEDPEERSRILREWRGLRRQIGALSQEEMIAEFVEDSVRATLARSRLKPDEEE